MATTINISFIASTLLSFVSYIPGKLSRIIRTSVAATRNLWQIHHYHKFHLSALQSNTAFLCLLRLLLRLLFTSSTVLSWKSGGELSSPPDHESKGHCSQERRKDAYSRLSGKSLSLKLCVCVVLEACVCRLDHITRHSVYCCFSMKLRGISVDFLNYLQTFSMLLFISLAKEPLFLIWHFPPFNFYFLAF